MNKSNDYIVTEIEKNYQVRAIESEAKGLYYLEDDEKKYFGIMTILNGIPNYVILKKAQAEKLIEELKEVYNSVFYLV
jgi:hypothetical protein